MTTPAPSRIVVALVGLLLLIGVVAPSPSGVAADQTVRFDSAGNAPHISLIGDSTLTGVRWYADYGPLTRFNFVLSAESCRRTFEQSCISREGYRSANVVQAMKNLDGELGDVLVVMSGYNDPIGSIDEAIDAVLGEARDQGVDHVVWLSLRTSADVDYSDPQEQSSINTFREYNEQLVAAAADSDGFLQIADWATYSNGASAWFEYDGVHLTATGADAVAVFIAGMVERVLAGENVSPAAAPWTVLVPGAEGDTVTAVQQALLDAGVDLQGGADGIYGNDTMFAVAEYQRRNEPLQVTGAVDLATARALGMFGDADESATAPPMAPAGPPASVETRRTDAVVAPPPTPARSSLRPWLLGATAAVGALALGVALRRRHVVTQRAARRWARVHPATSPHRSVADLRRTGRLPTDASPPAHLPASASATTFTADVWADTDPEPDEAGAVIDVLGQPQR